jgi:chromosome segregation ATPase
VLSSKRNGNARTLCMTNLTEAHERLARAVERLERAARESLPAADDAEAEIAALRARCRSLESRNAEIARRLDAAIARLRTALVD